MLEVVEEVGIAVMVMMREMIVMTVTVLKEAQQNRRTQRTKRILMMCGAVGT